MKNKLLFLDIIFVIFIIVAYPDESYAYLDPGTGSMLLSFFIGMLSVCYFTLRKLPSIALNYIFKIRKSKKENVYDDDCIAIYSESNAYWTTFKPILDELSKRNISSLYLTSNENDNVFKERYPACIRCKFIGKGSKAYATLNFIKASIMIMTTPGLDVLQIRRSKGVKKYIYIVHSLTDIHSYKYFSFDYYDEFICSGFYQAKSIREIEKIRGSRPKKLPVLGCPYFDLIEKRVKNSAPIQSSEITILLAPSWGKNGLLTRLGVSVPKILAEAGFYVIFRPHPQSYISEKELIKYLEQELNKYKNLVWDRQPDGFESMKKASILVSDFSGIVFDFAFGFLKPVISVVDTQIKDGFEAFDIPYEAWELSILNIIGKRIGKDDLNILVDIVKQYAKSIDMRDSILKLRENSVSNYGNCSSKIVDEILSNK